MMKTKRKPSNPAEFDRCVKAVKKRGGAANAYAVCTAAGTRNKGKKGKRNPADAAAQAFEEFHGRPSEEVVTVTQKIHYHGNLAAIGELKALKGVPVGGGKFALKGFDGAILCENEEKTQLFVRGGNQKVPIEEWNFPAKKELYDLGEVRVVEYFTTKDHLGKRDGGTAIYVHKFDPPYPELIYDAKNRQLSFAGGGYVMPPEGIDH
jgi:hypothetical protein